MKRVLVVLLSLFAGAVWAQVTTTPLRYNVVELSAEAQREVVNDLLTAQLYVEETQANSATLAASLNRAMAEALRVAREYPAVKVRTGANATYPVYAPRTTQPQGWRGRAELRLEARDFAAASALIGRLQASMQLAGIGYAIAPETRKAVENELITEAVAAFRGRAEIVQKALGGKGFRIQRIAVGTGYAGPPPRVAMMAARAEAAAVPAPPVEGGTGSVNVTVNGAVEIE